MTGIEERARLRPVSVMARMPTGAKLFLILSAALLPLAVIAFFATLQTTRTVDQEASARLRVAVAESSRALAIELIGDMTALRVALNALNSDSGDAPSCARVQGVFAEQIASGTRFMVTDRHGRLLCGSALPPALAVAPPGESGPISARIVPDQGVVLAITAANGAATGTAFFPIGTLAEIGRPSGFVPAYGSALIRSDERLELEQLPSRGTLDRRETQQVGLGLGGLVLEMSVHSAPITSPLVVALLLPILMWLAAASIAWFVVDRLLIRPLRRLRTSVAAYVPGEVIDPDEVRALPAQEIRELGDTFRMISRTVAAHEQGLAEGLVRQTRLTREVHHRVKNNLQVISSLINFHARAAAGREATEAYASIQRRVDALAVVHRNHFAEMEENRGLQLRSVIGELASNIRATAPEGSSQLGITLDIEPLLVNQDVAVAVAFLITELVELAIAVHPTPQIRISAKTIAEHPDRAILRISSPMLVDSDGLRDGLATRYGRVIEGLSRQLRARLHHDPLVGAYEIEIAITGRD
jgi:two-component system, sensor histidine kinase PdtaS